MKKTGFLHKVLLMGALLLMSASSLAAFPQDGKVENEKRGILLVAFGSSMPEGEAAIDAVAKAVASAYPKTEVRVAYTSRIIMRKIAREQKRIVDEPAIALAKMAYEGFTDVAVLSTHLIPGAEYDDLAAVVEGFRSMSRNAPKAGFRRLSLSLPLLASEEDCTRLAGILGDRYAKETEGGAVVLVGHGSHHFADAAYSALQTALWRRSPNFFVGTVEGMPSYDDVTSRMKANPSKRVTLVPCMLVAGDHAHNDIAGEESDSWRSMLTEAGYEVSAVLTGLGQEPAVAAMFVDKLREVAEEKKQ